MQRAVRQDMRFASQIGREKPVSHHVPYTRHVDEETLRTKDGMFLSIIKIDGFCHQTADQADIDMEASSRNTLLRALADSRFAVYSHIVRRRIPPNIDGEFDVEFCRQLNERYMQSLGATRMYSNALYLTVIRRGYQGKVGLADALFSKFRKASGISEKALELEARQELRDHVANIVKGFDRYGARVLKTVNAMDRCFQSPLSFWHSSSMGAWRQTCSPPHATRHYIPQRRITFGRRMLELRATNDPRMPFRCDAVDPRIYALYGRRHARWSLKVRANSSSAKALPSRTGRRYYPKWIEWNARSACPMSAARAWKPPSTRPRMNWSMVAP